MGSQLGGIFVFSEYAWVVDHCPSNAWLADYYLSIGDLLSLHLFYRLRTRVKRQFNSRYQQLGSKIYFRKRLSQLVKCFHDRICVPLFIFILKRTTINDSFDDVLRETFRHMSVSELGQFLLQIPTKCSDRICIAVQSSSERTGCARILLKLACL